MARHSQDIDRQVGFMVAERRLSCGLSQVALAETLGISFQQVQKYEKGLNRISASRLYHLAEVFDCSISDLFPAQSARSDRPVGLLASSEGVALAKAFIRISDPQLRTALSQVAVALAKA